MGELKLELDNDFSVKSGALHQNSSLGELLEARGETMHAFTDDNEKLENSSNGGIHKPTNIDDRIHNDTGTLKIYSPDTSEFKKPIIEILGFCEGYLAQNPQKTLSFMKILPENLKKDTVSLTSFTYKELRQILQKRPKTTYAINMGDQYNKNSQISENFHEKTATV